MENILIEAGLSKLQAQVYLYLLDNGSTYPTALMNKLKITRTNTYKVLESLERLGLARRQMQRNKASYYPEDPVALTSLVAEKRNSVIALEKGITKAMNGLETRYHKHRSSAQVEILTGRRSIEKSYTAQAELRQPIHFLKSRADIPFMGYETMVAIRKNQGKLSGSRYGITTDSAEAPKDHAIDRRTNLERTWIDENNYTAPVEWSVSGDMLVIQVFNEEGKSIVIRSDLVADAFRQLWRIADTALRSSEKYKNYPLKATRKK